jgi:hypothetical protein
MRLFYLTRRKTIWYVSFRDPVTNELGVKRSTKTSSKSEAESIAQAWLRDGMPDTPCTVQQSFCDYLLNFWDFDTSGYFRELATMGKEPKR